jgi:hypothetical protein
MGECRWRCVQHFLFSCKAFSPGCPDSNCLWLDLLDLLSRDTMAAARECQALRVHSFDAATVNRFCPPWVLEPLCFLSARHWSICAAACSVLAAYVFFVWSWEDHELNRARMRPGSNPGLPRATSRLFERTPGQVAYWVSDGFPFTNCMCISPLGAKPKHQASMA